MNNYSKLCEFEIWKNWMKNKRGTLIVVGRDKKEVPFIPTIEDLVEFLLHIGTSITIQIFRNTKTTNINYKITLKGPQFFEVYSTDVGLKEALINATINYLVSITMRVQ